MGFNALRDQVKSYSGDFDHSDILISDLPKGFAMNEGSNEASIHELNE